MLILHALYTRRGALPFGVHLSGTLVRPAKFIPGSPGFRVKRSHRQLSEASRGAWRDLGSSRGIQALPACVLSVLVGL